MPRNDEHECTCEKPDRLKGKPEDCSPEQICECHGEGAEHRCCHETDERK